jgi:hypothetical protein
VRGVVPVNASEETVVVEFAPEEAIRELDA